MRRTKGNIFELAESGKIDVLIYPCNCFHASKIPYREARLVDEKTSYGSKKLGTYTFAKIEEYNFIFVNAYTHQAISIEPRAFDYDSLKILLKKIKKQFTGKKIGYDIFPFGDWYVISKLIDEIFEGEKHKLITEQKK